MPRKVREFAAFILLLAHVAGCARQVVTEPVATRPAPPPAPIPHQGYTPRDQANRPSHPVATAGSRVYKLEFVTDFLVKKNDQGSRLSARLFLPPDTDSQRVLEWTLQPAPSFQAATQCGYRQEFLDLGVVAAGTSRRLTYRATVEMRPIRYPLDPQRVGALTDIPAQIRAAYLGDSPVYKIHSPVVQEQALAASAHRGPLDALLGIWLQTRARIRYREGFAPNAEVVLLKGQGNCAGVSHAIVAQCRAIGIPARLTAGSIIGAKRPGETTVDRTFHDTAEAYLPGYGWIPLESTMGWRISPVLMRRVGFGAESGYLFHFMYELENVPIPGRIVFWNSRDLPDVSMDRRATWTLVSQEGPVWEENPGYAEDH